ncbi:MAG: D-glycero-beta-D-manno-heptose 1,7-bisphosphate 7-phosphatase [Candidatus Latescibacterota bacterium]|jgi:D-glycero-D-manno-heptose 1,7-bisphosphate phosphatase
MGNKAAFLDRDGTILVERGHVTDTDGLEFLNGSAAAIAQFGDAGWRVLVVTNQSHVAKGLITEIDLEHIHRALQQKLQAAGARVDDIYHCPHHPEGTVPEYALVCECRKPRPGLLLRAAEEHGIDLPRSVMVGDALRDLQAGQSAGVGANVLVRTGYGAAVEHESHGADHVADDLAAAVRWIIARGDCD